MMQILGALSVPANLFNTRLMDLLVLRVANLSLEYGVTDESCIAFTFMTLVAGAPLWGLSLRVPFREVEHRSSSSGSGSNATRLGSTARTAAS